MNYRIIISLRTNVDSVMKTAEDDKKLISEEENQDKEYFQDLEQEVLGDQNLQEFMQEIDKDQDFNAAIEKILAKLNGIDMTMLQAEIIILLKRCIKLYRSKGKRKLEEISKSGDDYLLEQAHKISSYLMTKKSTSILRANVGLGLNSKSDRYQYNLDKKAERDFKDTLRRLATYEVYKIMNPRRLAGETKLENFVNNIITSGIKFAEEYESKSDVQHYHATASKLIKEAEKKHKQFKGSGGRVF